MSFSNKLRSILSVTGHKPTDLSECLNISSQAVRNKISRGSYSVDDMLKIFDYLECEVTVKTKDGIVFPLTIDDVREINNNIPETNEQQEAEDGRTNYALASGDGVERVQTVPGVSVADELLKFKKLLDAGDITEQEYEEQKAKLLSQ